MNIQGHIAYYQKLTEGIATANMVTLEKNELAHGVTHSMQE